MKPSLHRHLTCFAAVLALWQTAPAEDEPLATGENEPTPERIAWVNQNVPKVGAVRLNSLGLERANADQLARGLPPQTTVPAPHGLEVVPRSLTFSGAAAATAQNLPSAVDNSTLPWFPPIRSQGSIGSCVAWATTYYMGTHMRGLARGITADDSADDTKRLSPKWTYNFLNGGKNKGTHAEDALELLVKNGAPSWESFPYSGRSRNAVNYRQWPSAPATWREAASNRFESWGQVEDLDTAEGRQRLKAMLSNGYVCVFSTSLSNWEMKTVGNDRSTTSDDDFEGERACALTRKKSFGHKMTVVGYNDHIWVDLNNDGRVDAGEKGAFRVANSHGTDWEDEGFAWFCYDALRSTSEVWGADNADRSAGWGHQAAQYLVARASYTPTCLMEFNLFSSARSDIRVNLTSGTPGIPLTRDYTPAILRNQGGAYNFEGGSDTSSSITCVLDLTDIDVDVTTFILNVHDSKDHFVAAFVSDIRLTNAGGHPLGISTTESGLAIEYFHAAVMRGSNPFDDHPDTHANASVARLTSPRGGNLETITDADVFRIDVTDLSNVTICTTGPTDTHGELQDASGEFLIARDDHDGNGNFQINHDLRPGTYYIKVSSARRSHGSYRLVMTSTALPAPRMQVLGRSGLFNVNVADGSVLANELLGTQFADIGVLGETRTRTFTIRNTGTDELILNGSPLVRFHGAAPALFRVKTLPASTVPVNGSTTFVVEYAPLNPGAHSAVVSIPSNDLRTSPYEFAIRGSASFPVDAQGATLESAAAVNRPSQTKASLHAAGDVDMFKVTLPAAARLSASTSGSTDTVGVLLNASGKILSGNDNASLADRNFNITAELPAGTYFLRVSGRQTTTTGRYQLNIR